MTLSEELLARGFVHQFSAETLDEILDGSPRHVYHGIDPTADSIHAGNFAVFMLLRHLCDRGHRVTLLIGGGTGMIGDPKPDVERPLTPPEVVAARAAKLKAQAEQILGEAVSVVNNHDWLSHVSLIDFLRETGKHFSVGELIKKDAIATRLSSETGLSYTEFAYPLLQAYDYRELYRTRGCDLQVGGSDQWGNIVAGVDLIRRTEQASVHALTIPLITDRATGKKFGKSEGNAVWLDPEQTSPYQFYQFWFNTSDENVGPYLRIFTLVSLSEIAELEAAHAKEPAARHAQQRLAREVTSHVHGATVTAVVERVATLLFSGGDLTTLTHEERAVLLKNAPCYELTEPIDCPTLLVAAGLASSKREARTFISDGAVTLGGESVTDPAYTLDPTPGLLTTLRRGKKHYVVLYSDT